MMKPTFYLSFLVLLVIGSIAFVACSDTNSDLHPKVDQLDVIATLKENSDVKFKINNKDLKNKLLNYTIHPIKTKLNPGEIVDNNLIIIDNIEIQDTKDPSLAYIYYSVQYNEMRLSFATSLKKEKDGNVGFRYPSDGGGGETHTCDGAGCSSCGFVKDSAGQITGCKCTNTVVVKYGGRCNHSVTSN